MTAPSIIPGPDTKAAPTSVEPHLGIELPVAVSNIAGNAEEGNYLVINREQISEHHDCKPTVDLADSKYDTISNYNYIRSQGAIPIIDYNPRNEKLSRDDLLKRGYDQQGTPFAPCGLPEKSFLLCRQNHDPLQKIPPGIKLHNQNQIGTPT